MRRMKRMGSFMDVMQMIPGAGKLLPPGATIDEKQIGRVEAMISSMTEEERKKPKLLNAGRRKRIASGSGTSVQEINQLMRNYEQMKELMKRISKRAPGKPGKGGMRPRL
jgi:signal recognition particle subunit SRP54